MASLRRWLGGWRRSQSLDPTTNGINLVEPRLQPITPPQRLGIDSIPKPKPWTVARLVSILRVAEHSPTATTLLEARHARHCLSSFWLTAPIDQLEPLYLGPLGDVQRLLLEGPLPQQPLASDELQWRDALTVLFEQRADRAERLNVLLALMPYYPPTSFRLEDPLTQLPDWVQLDYANHCDPELKLVLQGPAGLLQPSLEESVASAGPELFPLSERRGEAALAWLEDAATVNRLAALINLYGLDPADQATRDELSALRDLLAQLWLDVSSDQIEQLYQTVAGTLSRSLMRCGFTVENLGARDEALAQHLASQLRDLSAPSALNHLLALMLYAPVSSLNFAGGIEYIPAWLQQEMQALA